MPFKYPTSFMLFAIDFVYPVMTTIVLPQVRGKIGDFIIGVFAVFQGM